ncbi:transmembrane protein 145 [Patella vulgata]|uniref:transmembrane protein 145 n=1 Tax=Patella vulgata TaxID=6465 RepID=UPI00217FCBC7|nr:transmembrane protein 145 [Patella vulgata]
MKNVNILSVLVLFTKLYVIDAKRVEGTIDTTSPESFANWVFITRFCFLSKYGTLEYKFVYPVEYATENVLLYFDEATQWAAVYKTSLNCSAKVAVLKPENNQIIALDQGSGIASQYSNCKIFTKDGTNFYNCTGTRTFRSARERWWFIALARCEDKQGQPRGLKLDYSIHMTNGGGLLTYEYSADEFYILPVDIAFLLAYLIMLALSIVCASFLQKRQLFHTTYKMYLVSVSLWTFHLFLLCIGYGMYGDTGYQQTKTILTARIFGSASILVFLLMLILMAKGYTITRGRLSSQGTIKLTVFTCIYIVVYSVMFIWEAELFDPGKVLYVYDSPPGYGLIAMRIVGWIWFLYAIFFTLKHFPNRGMFYYPFFGFFTVWFWAGPIVILISQHSMALWTREKTVNGVELLVALVGHAFFLIITRPNAANKNFPYHIRTTQIGAMQGTASSMDCTQQNGMEPNDNLPYSVTSNNMYTGGTGPDLTGLFTTSNTYTERPDCKQPPPFINNGFQLNENPEGRPTVLQGRLPPIIASAPPQYEALFQVGGKPLNKEG